MEVSDQVDSTLKADYGIMTNLTMLKLEVKGTQQFDMLRIKRV